jgi:hypothetical protein
MRRFTKRGGGWTTQLTGIRFGHLSTSDMATRIKTMIQGDKRLFSAAYVSHILQEAKKDGNLQNLKNKLYGNSSVTNNKIYQEQVYPLIAAVKDGGRRTRRR